jgi:hypothetical protein
MILPSDPLVVPQPRFQSGPGIGFVDLGSEKLQAKVSKMANGKHRRLQIQKSEDKVQRGS